MTRLERGQYSFLADIILRRINFFKRTYVLLMSFLEVMLVQIAKYDFGKERQTTYFVQTRDIIKAVDSTQLQVQLPVKTILAIMVFTTGSSGVPLVLKAPPSFGLEEKSNTSLDLSNTSSRNH